jgi:hypothetical protein
MGQASSYTCRACGAKFTASWGGGFFYDFLRLEVAPNGPCGLGRHLRTAMIWRWTIWAGSGQRAQTNG